MAARAGDQAIEDDEDEPPINPQLPPWRRIHSDAPDPVVQRTIAEAFNRSPSEPFPPTPPSTGFNFSGVS